MISLFTVFVKVSFDFFGKFLKRNFCISLQLSFGAALMTVVVYRAKSLHKKRSIRERVKAFPRATPDTAHAVCEPIRLHKCADERVASAITTNNKQGVHEVPPAYYLVESTGVEPVSKNPLIQPSPWAVFLFLDSPLCSPKDRLSFWVAL